MERVREEQESQEDKEAIADNTFNEEESLRKAKEQEAFQILRAILRRVIPVDRIHFRETQNYLTVTIDPNRLNDICRIYIGVRRKAIEILSEPQNLQRFENIDDLYDFEEPLLAYAKELEKNLHPSEEDSQ